MRYLFYGNIYKDYKKSSFFKNNDGEFPDAGVAAQIPVYNSFNLIPGKAMVF